MNEFGFYNDEETDDDFEFSSKLDELEELAYESYVDMQCELRSLSEKMQYNY